ncbi:MAG: hypothetical protein V2A73_13960 [Pseudomonadota bacterium]
MISLVHPNTTVELRYLVAYGCVAGEAQELDEVEFVASGIHADPRLGCSEAGWLEASLDSGATWTAVGTTHATAFALGAFAAGERKQANLRVTAPVGVRSRLVDLPIYLET